MPLAIIIALLLMGSVAVKVENAWPNQTLYPVKIHIFEELRSGIIFGAESRAIAAADRTGARLVEAEELRERGELTIDVRERLKAEFTAHVKEFGNRINALTLEGNTGAAARAGAVFEAHLREYERGLRALDITIKDISFAAPEASVSAAIGIRVGF